MATETLRAGDGNSPDIKSLQEEAALSRSLLHLLALHKQLRSLRETVPSLLQPIHVASPSPEVLLTTFSQAASKAVAGVVTFQTSMRSKETQEILAKARDSAAKTPEDGKVHGWLGARGGEWMIEDEKLGVQMLEEASIDDDAQDAAENMDAPQAIARFKSLNPAVEVVSEDDGQLLKMVLPQPMGLEFKITKDPSPSQKPTYTATATGKGNLHAGITRAVAQRPDRTNLWKLLDLLAAYQDVTKRRCGKCERVLDPHALFAVVLKDEAPKGDPDSKTKWSAYHLDCEQPKTIGSRSRW